MGSVLDLDLESSSNRECRDEFAFCGIIQACSDMKLEFRYRIYIVDLKKNTNIGSYNIYRYDSRFSSKPAFNSSICSIPKTYKVFSGTSLFSLLELTILAKRLKIASSDRSSQETLATPMNMAIVGLGADKPFSLRI